VVKPVQSGHNGTRPVEIADVGIEHNFKYFKPIVFLPGNLANCYFINECKK
jgi:hypothetical protein